MIFNVYNCVCIYVIICMYLCAHVASTNTANCYESRYKHSTIHFNIHGNSGYHQQQCVYIVQLMMGNPMQSSQIQATIKHCSKNEDPTVKSWIYYYISNISIAYKYKCMYMYIHMYTCIHVCIYIYIIHELI